MKLSGKMRNKLPFVLPCGDDSHLSRDSLSPFLSDGSSLGTMHLSNDNLAHMNEIYKKEIPQVQSLWTIYQMEKEVARKKGNLKKFPKFTNWRPEGSQAISDVHLSILEGLQPTAVLLSTTNFYWMISSTPAATFTFQHITHAKGQLLFFTVLAQAQRLAAVVPAGR